MNKKILFIAKNIPTPQREDNKIILTIAQKLSVSNNISFLFPKEKVPWGIHFLKKYNYLYKLESWTSKGFKINVMPYVRLPIKNSAFAFLNINKIPLRLLQNIDIVHAHYLFPDGLIAQQISHKYAYPYIITLRKSDVHLLKSLKSKSNTWKKAEKSLQDAEKILCLNKGVQDFVKAKFNIDSVIVPHGIDKLSFSKQKKLNSKSIVISVVGNCIKTKNIDWVIKATKKYNGHKKIELLIIGDGPELEYYKSIGNLDNITFLGKVKHEKVLSFLERSNIFALPSSSETFGLVYLEAAANYNAMIGWEKEGVWGVFEPDLEMLFASNYNDFEKLLHNLIDDTAKTSDLALQAYEKAKTMTWEKVIKQYNDIYDEIDIKH